MAAGFLPGAECGPPGLAREDGGHAERQAWRLGGEGEEAGWGAG